MTELQRQARALGDPTRHDIFRYIADAGRPVDVAELTAHLGLNHNAIRQHLAKLVDAKLVTEATAPTTGRGRPRLVYELEPAADGRWGITGPYERLSLLLSEMLRSGESAEEVGRRAGRRSRLGGGRTSLAPVDPVDVVNDEMARHGFDPTVRRRGAKVEITLRHCPFATLALADPDTVCGIHLGLAEGIADMTEGRVVVDELIPRDPRRANCRLCLHVEPSRAG